MEDGPMLIWIGIATAWVACLAIVVVLVARAPIMDEDPDLEERNGFLRGKRRG